MNPIAFIGDIFDGCVNPLSAALMKLDRLSADRPDDAELQDAARLVRKATERFVHFRTRWLEFRSTHKIDSTDLSR
jgi:hypothetical protein